MSSLARRYVRPVALCALCILLTACAADAMRYVDQGTRYTADEVDRLARDADPPSFAGDEVAEAAELRHESLVDLRAKGGTAADLADVLTEDFPSDTRAVPFFAEAAFEDDSEVWIVLEVYGPAGGSLDTTRLWVLDRGSGRVVRSTSFR